MKLRSKLDSIEAGEGVRIIKDLVQRDWHFASVGMGNCRAAQSNRRELNKQLLIQSAALANANFDSDEPRDLYGQWTTNATGTATNSPIAAQPIESGETSQSISSARQVHALDGQTKPVTDHATKNPFLHQLFHRALRVLTTFGPNSAGLKELSGLSKAIVADAAATMMQAPEFGGNIRAFILGKEMPVDKALRDSALEQQFRGETPTATVAGRLSENLAEELPMMLAMRGLPVGVQKILDTIFTLKMLKDAPGIAKQLIDEYHKPTAQRDYNKIDSLVADAIETLGFTTLGIFGSKKSSKGEPAKIREEAVETKEAAAKKESESPNAETSGKVTADEIPKQNRYRATFFAAHPELRGKVIVHHAIEQKVLKRYPGVMTASEIHNLANLRGIPTGLNSKVHLSRIRNEWNAFYREHRTSVTKEQLINKAKEIDQKFGRHFKPPVSGDNQ